MTKKYSSIELLRFFSSLSVIFYHYKLTFVLDNGVENYDLLTEKLPFYQYLNIFYNFGFYGVNLFFIISGFVFAHIYFSKNNLISGKEFFINRFARLYPLHFATIVLLIFFQFLDPEFIKLYFDPAKNTYFDLYHFFLNISFMHAWGFEKGWSFNPPSWSISVEIGAYLIFFLLLHYLRLYKIWLTLLIVTLLFISYKIPSLNFKYNEFILLFFMGVAIYQLSKTTKPIILLIFCIFFLFMSFYGRNFKILLFCPSLLLAAILFEGYIKNIRIKNLLAIFGNTTYSLYLLHYPFMLVFLWLELKYNFFKDFHEKYIFFTFFFFSLILLSICSFYLFEHPLNKKIRQKLL
jgi:peptidoglycan/LPS O-acetylase OafA/YrhL|tara:strand:+ start:96 stop:1142 length:1047 start_codon:yes stop_codon:yes gene_type:complete